MHKAPASSLLSTKTSFKPRSPAESDMAVTSRPITVCHPVWRLGRGGLERQLVQVVNRLPRNRFNHVVVVCGWDEGSELLASQLGEHVRIVREPLDHRAHNWSRKLAARLAEHAVDVIHVRGMSLLLDSLLAADLYGNARIACSFHGFQTPGAEFQGVRKKVYREAFLRCIDRWAVGEKAAAAIATELNLPRESFGIVRNGVDTDFFRPSMDRAAVRAQLGLPADRTIVLCVGNLKPIKGQAVLLEAIERMGAAAEEACFVFVGEDGLDGKLQHWARQRLADFDVRFMGEQDDPRAWYQAADMFAQPSLSEGLSNVLLEAMACGLPAIATNVGGNAEAIVDGQSGWLVPAGDAAGLAFAMTQLVTRPAMRSELSIKAREQVSRRFSLEAMIGEISARYQKLGEPADEGDSSTAKAGVFSRRRTDATISV